MTAALHKLQTPSNKTTGDCISGWEVIGSLSDCGNRLSSVLNTPVILDTNQLSLFKQLRSIKKSLSKDQMI